MSAGPTTQAILLRRIPFGETSFILVWLSPDHGKVRTAARGTGRKQSPLRGRLDLFYHAEINYTTTRRTDLHSLRECRLLETWDGLREDYGRLLVASYFAELCDLLSEPDQASPGLFDLLQRALGHLCRQPPTRRAVEFFESEACRVLGFGHDDNALGALEAHAGRIPINRRRLSALWS
jgi:DNA repair protein RecO (recombination protein O)